MNKKEMKIFFDHLNTDLGKRLKQGKVDAGEEIEDIDTLDVDLAMELLSEITAGDDGIATKIIIIDFSEKFHNTPANVSINVDERVKTVLQKVKITKCIFRYWREVNTTSSISIN